MGGARLRELPEEVANGLSDVPPVLSNEAGQIWRGGQPNMERDEPIMVR